MKKQLLFYIGSFFSIAATLIVTPMSASFLYTPETPEELK